MMLGGKRACKYEHGCGSYELRVRVSGVQVCGCGCVGHGRIEIGGQTGGSTGEEKSVWERKG